MNTRTLYKDVVSVGHCVHLKPSKTSSGSMADRCSSGRDRQPRIFRHHRRCRRRSSRGNRRRRSNNRGRKEEGAIVLV